MGLKINTNMEALDVHNNMVATNNRVANSLKRLSSGLRITSAKDDTAGFAIANSFSAKITSMRVASQNASEAQSMLQTADGAYNQINNILVRMKSLATQAASGQTESLPTMNNEFNALQNEIDRIASSTRYGGINLLNRGSQDFSSQINQYGSDVTQLQAIAANSGDPDTGAASSLLFYMAQPPSNMTLSAANAGTDALDLASYSSGTPGLPSRIVNFINDMVSQANTINQALGNAGGITFQVGTTNSNSDQIVVKFDSATASALGVSSTIGINGLASAQAAMSAIDTALTSINSFMGTVGAYQNRMQYTIDNLSTSIEEYSSSESTIRDVDMSSEISDFTKNQILQQAGMAMLAQANSGPQQILTLLR